MGEGKEGMGELWTKEWEIKVSNLTDYSCHTLREYQGALIVEDAKPGISPFAYH